VTSKIANDAVTSAKVALDSLTATDLATGSVDSAEIAADAVGSSEIATDAVGAAEIAADAVGSSEIAIDAVGAAEVATDAIGSAEIAAGAVGSSEVALDSLTADDLATGAVTTAEILNGTIAGADLDPAISIATTGTVAVGSGGTAVSKHFSVLIPAVDLAATAAGACTHQTLSTAVTGAAAGDTVTITPLAVAGGLETTSASWNAHVSAADTVQITVCAEAASDPGLQQWRIDLWKH
jgi:hypothetical protein